MIKLVVLLTSIVSLPLSADILRIAVASNFMGPARELVQTFEKQSAHQVTLSFGSTGKLYAQIHHGAPFDLFMSADRASPQRLAEEGEAIRDTLSTYAYGRLVLWSPEKGLKVSGGKVLQHTRGYRYLAIANPRLAPYGRAAKEALESLSLWSRLQPNLVRGENIGQTLQFVRSGNAQLGFVALSQILSLGESQRGDYWLVPETMHSPIEQTSVLLKDSQTGRDFVQFLRTEIATEIIERYGYRVSGLQSDG